MPEAMWIKIIGTAPSVLWVMFAIVVYFTLRGTIIQRMVPRLRAVRAFGVEIELASELLDRAQVQRQAVPDPMARRTALGRLEHAAELLRGGKILWVDDHPGGNAPLVELFRSCGIEVELALSTEEADLLFRRRSYDILISDVARGGNPRAGFDMLRLLEQFGMRVPVLIYTGHFDPEQGLDRRVFAATTDPIDLVHYVIDLMERARLTSL
jgi:CheY-like chemotaxis protein